MNNHTEILVNVLKSVAYDDNWASQHENAHWNQLRNKAKLSTLFFDALQFWLPSKILSKNAFPPRK